MASRFEECSFFFKFISHIAGISIEAAAASFPFTKEMRKKNADPMRFGSEEKRAADRRRIGGGSAADWRRIRRLLAAGPLGRRHQFPAPLSTAVPFFLICLFFVFVLFHFPFLTFSPTSRKKNDEMETKTKNETNQRVGRIAKKKGNKNSKKQTNKQKQTNKTANGRHKKNFGRPIWQKGNAKRTPADNRNGRPASSDVDRWRRDAAIPSQQEFHTQQKYNRQMSKTRWQCTIHLFT